MAYTKRFFPVITVTSIEKLRTGGTQFKIECHTDYGTGCETIEEAFCIGRNIKMRDNHHFEHSFEEKVSEFWVEI